MKPGAVTMASSTASRIGQLVRLLGSDRSGEVVAAAAAIKRTLSVAGTDIHHLGDIVDRGLQQAPPIAPQLADSGNIAAIVRFCASSRNQLTERERDFIRSMHDRLTLVGDGFAPTEKQRAWLLGIHQRLRSQR
jgi:hypothetical protein